LQPGPLLDQPLKSMRANSFQLIKFCCIRTDTAAETKAIGLQADASASWRIMVFAMSPRQFYRDVTNPAHLSGPHHLDNFIVTPNTHSLIGTLQKHMPTRTRTATQLNRRAVRLSKNLPFLFISMGSEILQKTSAFVS
jgi:hypothetical protein